MQKKKVCLGIGYNLCTVCNIAIKKNKYYLLKQ